MDALAEVIGRAPGEGGAWSGPPTPLETSWTRGETPPPMPTAALLLGDFNADPDSEAYRRVTGDLGLVDSRVAAGHAASDGVTYKANSEHPGSRNERIDYCFVTVELVGLVSAAWIDNDAEGSDHQPVWAELEI